MSVREQGGREGGRRIGATTPSIAFPDLQVESVALGLELHGEVWAEVAYFIIAVQERRPEVRVPSLAPRYYGHWSLLA